MHTVNGQNVKLKKKEQTSRFFLEGTLEEQDEDELS